MSEPIGQTTTTELIILVLAAYPERKWDNRKNGKRGSYRIGFFLGGEGARQGPPTDLAPTGSCWVSPSLLNFPRSSGRAV